VNVILSNMHAIFGKTYEVLRYCSVTQLCCSACIAFMSAASHKVCTAITAQCLKLCTALCTCTYCLSTVYTGAIVPSSFDDFPRKISEVYQKLLAAGTIVPAPEPPEPKVLHLHYYIDVIIYVP
jgi:hypothetical protein